MKKYSVLCLKDPEAGFFNIVGVQVMANDPEDAKKRALIYMKENGYSNARIAPELPGASVVMEIT